MRLVIQAMYFAAIARSLGVSNYGAFLGVTALVGVTFPFGSLGSGHLLIRQVARDPSSFSRAFGEALVTTAAMSSVLLALVLLTARFTLPSSIPLFLVFLVALADLFGLSLITIATQAFQAFELLKWSATINVLISASRLTGAILMIAFVRHPSPLQWGYVYFGSTAVVTIIASRLVIVKLGAPRPTTRRSWHQIKEGLYFSISLSSQSIYNDLDKTMLARLSTLGATGIYGAAYRIVDVSFSPRSGFAYCRFIQDSFARGSWVWPRPCRIPARSCLGRFLTLLVPASRSCFWLAWYLSCLAKSTRERWRRYAGSLHYRY